MIAVNSSRPTATDRTIAVGIGQYAVTSDGECVLVSYGLGSCVGISCWDAVARVAGLIHILLPEPMKHDASEATPTRFASTGIPFFLQKLEEQGAHRSRLHIVAAGGAQMLGALSLMGATKAVGSRNTEAVQATLSQEGLRLSAHDFGGSTGRTIGLVVANGTTWVRAAGGVAHDL